MQLTQQTTMDNLMAGVIHADDSIMYDADGSKSAEQTRSEILEKRLNLLIQYMGANLETGATFGDYLKEKKISLESFLSKLPEEYQFKDIDKITLADQDDTDSLLEYINDLNVLNAEQYESYDERKADEMADAMTDEVYMNAYGDDEWHEAKGKRKEKRAKRKKEQKEAGGLKGKEARAAKKKARQEAKEARKKAKAEKKAIKKQLKADVKSGKISRGDKRKAMKGARKDFREKAGGSFVGRAGRKLRKFDPGLAAMRNAYNSLLRINMFNQAYNLGRIMDENGKYWKKVEKMWANFGGEIFSLKNNIKLARNKKPPLGKKKYTADGSDDWNYVAPAVAAPAWVALATAALGASGGIISAFKKDKGEPEVEEENPDLPEDTTTDDAIKAETERILAGTDTPEDDDESDGGIMDSIAEYKWWIIGTLGLLTVGGILLAVMGKKKS